MEQFTITLKIKGKTFGVCSPDKYDAKILDSILSKVKFRVNEASNHTHK